MGEDTELRDLATDYILESVEIGTGEHAEEMVSDPRVKALSTHYNYKFETGEKAIIIYSCPAARDGSNDVLPPTSGILLSVAPRWAAADVSVCRVANIPRGQQNLVATRKACETRRVSNN